jgi:hypothetical protein
MEEDERDPLNERMEGDKIDGKEGRKGASHTKIRARIS